jgi:hypothetical protein
MELRTLKEISEVATSLTGVAAAVIGGVTAFFRGLPSRRQRWQVAYDIVKKLRAADFSEEGPRQDLRLEYWYGALTGTMSLGAAEIRRAASLRPAWKGLRDFALARSLLLLKEDKQGESAPITYRHPKGRKFELAGYVLGYTVSSLLGLSPMFFASQLGLHGWSGLLLALGCMAPHGPLLHAVGARPRGARGRSKNHGDASSEDRASSGNLRSSLGSAPGWRQTKHGGGG